MKQFRYAIKSVILPLTEEGEPLPDDRESLQSVALGTLYREQENLHLSFCETDENGRTETTIVCRPGYATVRRSGAVCSSFRLETGLTDQGIYRVTPYSFPLAVTGENIMVAMTEAGGSLRLSYRMELGGQQSRVSFLLTAEPNETEEIV